MYQNDSVSEGARWTARIVFPAGKCYFLISFTFEPVLCPINGAS